MLKPAARALLALAFAVAGLVALHAHAPRTAQASAAQDLAARVTCNDDVLAVTFSWQSSGGGHQWLDVSLLDNGFAWGTFAGTGPLSPSRQSLHWDDAAAGTTYYARVNTFDGHAWSPSSTLTVTTPPCGAVPLSQGMQDLQSRLESEIAAWGFQTAVAVTDLQTGETISVNGDRHHFAGCAVNLLVLMQTVIDLENGLYEESRVGDLIAQTIWGSNPITARDLLHVSGEGDLFAAMHQVNDLIEELGLTDTFYDHPPAFFHETLEGRSNLTTALDLNRALSGLYHATVMSPEWRDYLLEKLVGVKPGLNYLIPAGVGDGVVSHKNGFLVLPDGWIDNDTGIVRFQRGGQTYAYALTFLTQQVPTEYGDIPLGQAVSSMVWQFFNNRY